MTMSRPRSLPSSLAGRLLVIVACAMPGARGQENPPPAYDRWSKLEASDELREYRNALRDGVFEDASRNFLARVALPQLGLESNRGEIDRVRRKMFDRLCAVDQGAEPKGAALEGAMRAVSDFMIGVARDEKADPVYRVNATLLVGELRGPGNKPWAPAVAPLVALLGDGGLPPAVRIAAAAGLARQVDAEPEARAADVGPALVALVGSPLAGVDPVAADWLRSRALGMLAKMGAAAPADTAAAAGKVLRDADRALDVRVRAAATVGRCLNAAGAGDVAAAVATIRELAQAALEATKARSDRLELAAKLAGGGDGGMGPRPLGGPGDLERQPTGMDQVYRRDAWRLAVLADALSTDGGGLVRVAGPSAAQVGELATVLREVAEGIDTRPDGSSIDAAIERLTELKSAPSAAAPDGAKPAAAEPENADDVPFGAR